MQCTGWCPYCSEPVLLDIAEEHMQEKHPELCGGDREREEGEVTPRSGEADEDEVAFTLDCVDARSVVKVLRGHTGHTLVPKKSVRYIAQFLASADFYCACARFCYSVSPWVTFQKF